MIRSLLTYSVWISLLPALISCQAPGLTVSGHGISAARESIAGGTAEKVAFRALISYREQELTGQMIIKKDADGRYRVAFFGEFGMTYFEAQSEVVHSSKFMVQSLVFEVRSVTAFLDHPMIIKSLEKSLRMALSAQEPKTIAGERETLVVQLRNGFRMEMKLP